MSKRSSRKRRREVPADRCAVPGTSLQDLDQSLLPALLPRKGSPTDRDCLQRNGILAAVSQPEVTVAALIALGREPSAFIPGARVVFNDSEQSRKFALHPWIVDMRAGCRSWPYRMAVLELLVNGLLHRDWSQNTWDLPVEMRTGERSVRVTSPGAFVPPSTKKRARPRNVTLVRFARKLGWGAAGGLDWVRSEMETLQIELTVETVDGQTVASLRGASPTPVEPVVEAAPPAVPSWFEAPESVLPTVVMEDHRLNMRDRRVLAYITVSKSARTGEVMQALRCSRTTARTTLHHLIKCGWLKRRSQASTSPFQAYIPVAGLGPKSDMGPLSDRQQRVLQMITERGELSSRELRESLGWSRSTVRDALTELVERALIERTLAKIQSPKQRYRLRSSVESA